MTAFTTLEEKSLSVVAGPLSSYTMAIQVDGVTHLTIADARSHFGVSEKTIYGWIEKGVIPEPRTVDRGMQTFYVFDEKYFARADAALLESRRRNQERKRGAK